MTPPHHILVAIDFGPCTMPVMDVAAVFARAFGARITLVHTVEPGLAAYPGAEFVSAVDLMQTMTDCARVTLEPLRVKLANSGLAEVDAVACYGVAWEQILSTAEERRAELIVMGTHGRRGLARALLGSNAERVVRAASVPVLTLHAT